MPTALRKQSIHELLQVTEGLNSLRDIDTLLGQVLRAARRFTRADAGSIYLVENGRLRFRYVQNDTLMRGPEASKALYVNRELPIDDRSIAGFVASTGRPLLIRDAYHLRESDPYAFNRAFDERSGYRTRSVLSVPLVTANGQLTGVVQVINPVDEGGEARTFSSGDQLLVLHFARQAAVAIERAKMTREIILRMVKVAELRDPTETGAHVNRVGAISIEIYNRWARDRGVPPEEIHHTQDVLRIAAMLHDVGKVAISDTILKKAGKLSPEEFTAMKAHTVIGARLFADSASDWDDMAAEIALCHHERWDGSGYPGPIGRLFDEPIRYMPGRRGEEIPLAARIVSVADVYDALTVKRCYKECWTPEQALEEIRQERGKSFDPGVTDAFLAIPGVAAAIGATFS